MTLSIIIVSWNTRTLLEKCLSSILGQDVGDVFEVIVFDNGSTDGTAEMILREFQVVKLIRSSNNLGFARAVNLGVEASSGEFILLLNSDIIAPPGSIAKLLAWLRRYEEAGALAPKLLYPDGTFQESVRRFPRPCTLLLTLLGHQDKSWHVKKLDDRNPQKVEQPMMSALLIRKSCWREVGFLDERFPIFFNDVDWCWRLYQETSWSILYIPEVFFYHSHGESTKKLGLIRKVLLSQKGLYHFYKKHIFKDISSSLLKILWISLISLGIPLRLLLSMLKK